MKFQKTPIALAALALCAAAPFAAEAAPSVSFTSPQDGATIGQISSYVCTATASNASRVEFSLVSSAGVVKALNTDKTSPYNCYFNSYHYLDGNWTLRAIAHDRSGAKATATRTITINNKGTSTGGTTTNPTPVVSFTKPANGTSVAAGSTVSCGVTASDADGIQKVEWFLDGKLTGTETSAPYDSCNVGSLTAGSHVIKARATDKKGATGEAQVTVDAGSTSSGGTGGGGTLPTAQFTVPTSGGVLKGDANGVIQGPPNCTLTGTNLAKVVFFMDGVQTNYDGNGANGWGCWLNTNSYTPGTHTLKAVAYNSAGQSVTVSQPVVIEAKPGTNTAPTVSITKPSAGAALAGNVTTAMCEAGASDANGSIAGVQFSLTSSSGTKTSLQNDGASPYQCSFDSETFANGTYTLSAVATDNAGATATSARTVSINNTGGGTPPPAGAIDPADIKASASADVLFSQQPNIYTDVLGSTPWMSSIAETGRHGTVLPNGETLRFGKEADPVNPARKAMTFQLAPSDPTTGGSKRVELGFPRNIEMDKVYWLAVSVYVNDWGTLGTSDQSLFGFQLHSGTKLDLSPTIALYTTKDGRSFKVSTRYSTSASPSQSNSVSTHYAEQPIPFGRWMDFVIKFKQNTSGAGFAQVWMDGNLIVNHQGNLGFDTPGYLDFMKWGYYNWTSAFASPRKVRLRGPTLVADPTGSKYTAADLRAVLTGEGSSSATAGATSGISSTADSTGSTGGSTSGGGVCSTITCAAQ